MLYPYSGILTQQSREININTRNNIINLTIIIVSERSQTKKECMGCDPIHIKFYGDSITSDRKHTSHCWEVGKAGWEEQKVTFGGD